MDVGNVWSCNSTSAYTFMLYTGETLILFSFKQFKNVYVGSSEVLYFYWNIHVFITSNLKCCF